MIRIFNMLESEANSLERIQSYLEIDHEPAPTENGVPPAYWPASGSLRVENLTARYSSDGPVVLDKVSFEVKAGERVGIVGRTGSGKSTLTLALLRCIVTDGEVYYDDLPTSALNLDALRSNVTIIPQAPELLSGTLRKNLDMFGKHDDAELNDALRSAGLFTLQTEADESRLTLDSQIAAGGGNVSVGQRQIIALARAMVRQSKLLILDEATSAIDYETDAVIQASLRTELKSDVTVICVAHRLQSVIDSDKIVSVRWLLIRVHPADVLSSDGSGCRQAGRVRQPGEPAGARGELLPSARGRVGGQRGAVRGGYGPHCYLNMC
jgi:ABC-type multidrug transport system fused ATPase/permease subunit